MKKLMIFLFACMIAAPLALAEKPAPNLDAGVALHGYDPVSYFQGGPRKGDSGIPARHDGALYHFVTTANRDLFQANPTKFAPAYGGWCAWAMLDGELADIDPKSYKIVDGRLLLFYDGIFADTRAKWNRRAEKQAEGELITQADRKWGELDR